MPEGNGEEDAAADAGAEQQPMQEGYRRGDDIPSGYYSRFNVRPGDDII